jgi:GGDEF domain-containing protein
VAEYIEKEKDRAGEGLPVPTLSFGIAVFPDCGNDADDLIRTADQAMYEAKREGGNRWRFSAGLPEEAKPESEVSGTTA